MQPKKPGHTYRARPAAVADGKNRTRPLLVEQADARVRTERGRRRIWLYVAAALVLVLLAGAGFAYQKLSETTGVVLKGVGTVFNTPVPARPAENPAGAPTSAAPPVFPNWDKKEPVNVLLIGLDYRPEEADSRADTQIVVHIDPANKTATMLSIPRDLWVKIPGYGENRVNAAFQLGEDHKDTVPGGGPGLAMATVQEDFGIPIHYYAQVDFTGFENIVDSIGGINVDVPKPLVDNEYPFQDYGYTRIYIPAGLQHMDGRTALQYARSRHADSDLGRNSRQQQVLMGIRTKGLSVDILPHFNDFISKVSDAVRTDLSLSQVGSLIQLARDIDTSKIDNVLISADMVTETNIGGADVLLPNWDVIRPTVQKAFANPTLARENARLSVVNGTTTGGVARKVSTDLTAKGFNVVDVSSASDQGQHPTTTIIDYSGGTKPLTVQALLSALNLGASSVKQVAAKDAPVASADGSPVDIVVMVGDDKAN